MFPILYDQITAGEVPQHNGLGVLSDCVSCFVEQGTVKYELTMVYMASGIHAEEIAERRIIKVKPNFTDDPQLFRIDRIGKTMNGKFTVYGKHISYDLSGYEITSGTANSAVAACALLQSAATGYTIQTDKSVNNTFTISTPASVRSYFVGRSGSFVDVFGASEIKYNNFNVNFLLHAGANRGVTIRYGKNLLELSQEIDTSNMYTHVICFYKNGTDDAVVGNKVATGLTLDVPKTLILDVTSQLESEPSVSDLTTMATNYISENNLTVPSNNITLDFVQSGELTDRVDLYDVVSVYYEALGITRSNIKCIRTKYDCIKEKYVETEFGDFKGGITETITTISKDVAEKPSTTQMEGAINHATAQITGNLGGCVVNGRDTNNDGIPDENLILNTNDISTATKVIRMNIGGIGFSKQGYSGNYQTAIGFDGIVADAITTGTLNADLIKAGVISDALGHSEIDMSDGTAKMWELNAIKGFNLLSEGDEDVRSTFDALEFATRLILSPDDADYPFITLDCFKRQAQRYARLWLSNNGTINTALIEANDIGGSVTLKNENGNTAIQFFANSTYGGNWYLNNTSGNNRFHAFVGNVNDDGILDVFDGSGNATINLVGHNGEINCGKVKPSGNQWEQLYTGSLSSGYVTTDYEQFNTFVVVAKTTSSSSYNTIVIPKVMLTDQDQSFCIADDTNYVTFYARVVFDDPDYGTFTVFTFRSRNSSGSIQKIYGSYT